LLPSYRDLARFAEDAGVLSHHQVDHLCAQSEKSPQPAQRALKSAIQMREAMSEVFYALAREKPVPKAALAILNRYVQEAAQHAKLVTADGHFAWQFDPAQDNLESPLWPIARSAAELLASDQLQYVRACASPTCEWLFLDESKNHRRRWCDMTKCGNRAKVQNFYERKRKSED
jgi:predicted RNA-binding Zn ribbon-like protein